MMFAAEANQIDEVPLILDERMASLALDVRVVRPMNNSYIQSSQFLLCPVPGLLVTRTTL